MPNVIFTQPFLVNASLADKCGNKVVVLDLAFNGGSPQGKGTNEEQYQATTASFINALGDRLVAWVDHHPHRAWSEYSEDARFHLFSREEAPACPPLITTDLVRQIGETDTIVAHGDFDGVISACKWALEGREVYHLADEDSIAADSRVGTLSPMGLRLEEAMKANLADDSIRQAIFDEFVYGSFDASAKINDARERYAEIQQETQRLAKLFEINGRVAYVDAAEQSVNFFDLTQLLLAGQKVADVAVVRNAQRGNVQVTIAGPKSWNFVEMFGL